jgi:succinate dehydrogenase / fumarate reductase flavoprotein subunit
MGGIPTNLHGEVVALRDGDPECVVPGLMAIGEGACVSVHGANRLCSNSLIDLLVFGRAAACRAVEVVHPIETHPPLPDTASERAIDRLDRIRHAAGARHAGEIRVDMQRIMQRHCAVFRDGLLLEEGARKSTPSAFRTSASIIRCSGTPTR